MLEAIYEQDFLDSLDRKKLKEMLEVRVVDGSLLRCRSGSRNSGIGAASRRARDPCHDLEDYLFR